MCLSPGVIVESPPPDCIVTGVSRYNTRRHCSVTRQRMQQTVAHVTNTTSNVTSDMPLFAVSLRHAFVPFTGKSLVCVVATSWHPWVSILLLCRNTTFISCSCFFYEMCCILQFFHNKKIHCKIYLFVAHKAILDTLHLWAPVN